MENVELSEDVSVRTQFTVDDLDIEILPLIYEIIRRYLFFMKKMFLYISMKIFKYKQIFNIHNLELLRTRLFRYFYSLSYFYL